MRVWIDQGSCERHAPAVITTALGCQGECIGPEGRWPLVDGCECRRSGRDLRSY